MTQPEAQMTVDDRDVSLSWTERLRLRRAPQSTAKTDETPVGGMVSSVLTVTAHEHQSTTELDDQGAARPSHAAPLSEAAPTSAPSRGLPVPVRWSRDLRGWIAVTDPVTGETHEIPYRDAPAVWQAAVRRRPS